MNESATILILSIVGVWFFTSSRFQAFKTVLTYQPPIKTADPNAGKDPNYSYTPEERAKIKEDEAQTQKDLQNKGTTIPGVGIG